jgi:hypothetical protein
MLEHVCKALALRQLILGADVKPDLYRHDGAAEIFEGDDPHAVLERYLVIVECGIRRDRWGWTTEQQQEYKRVEFIMRRHGGAPDKRKEISAQEYNRLDRRFKRLKIAPQLYFACSRSNASRASGASG